jgi:hypothetical protein
MENIQAPVILDTASPIFGITLLAHRLEARNLADTTSRNFLFSAWEMVR